MTVIINGTDNAVGNPAIQGGTGGTSAGLYYPAANTVAITTSGVNALTISSTQAATFAGTLATASQGITSASLPAGTVLQVVNATYTSTTTTTTTTFVDTGLTASITPKFATSKILVIVDQAGCGKNTNDTTLNLQLLRGSTVLIRFEGSGGWTSGSVTNFIGTCSCNYLDSPATTSSVTYKTQQMSFNGGASTYTQRDVGAGSPSSTITLMEIAG